MPVLSNPSSVMGLLLGRDIDLFRLDLPQLDLQFSIAKFFPLVGPIGVEIAGTFKLHADLAFGYDTLGLRKFTNRTTRTGNCWPRGSSFTTVWTARANRLIKVSMRRN